MAGGDELLGTGRALGAILFLAASTNAFDAYSTLMSSPWTAENFGADDRKTASAQEYLFHAIGITSLYAVAAAAISASWWPIFGTLLVNVYLYWLYQRAIMRGRQAGSSGWRNN